MVSALIAQVLAFIFTSFVVILVLNLMREGDVSDFIKLLLVTAIMLFGYPLVSAMPPQIQTMVNSFIAWVALIKVTSEQVTFWHAAITSLVATVFVVFLLPALLGLL